MTRVTDPIAMQHAHADKPETQTGTEAEMEIKALCHVEPDEQAENADRSEDHNGFRDEVAHLKPSPSAAVAPNASLPVPGGDLPVCISAIGIARPIPSKAGRDHHGGDVVSALGGHALRDDPTIPVPSQIGADDIVGQQMHQKLRGLSTGRVSVRASVGLLRCIDAPDPISVFPAGEGVAIDDANGWLCRSNSAKEQTKYKSDE